MRAVLEEDLYRAILIQVSQCPPVLDPVELSATLGIDVDELLRLGVEPDALLCNSRQYYFSALATECSPHQDNDTMSEQKFVDFGCRLSEALRIEANFHQFCNENGERVDWSANADGELAKRTVMDLLTAYFRLPSFGQQASSVATQSAQIVYELLDTFTDTGTIEGANSFAHIQSIFGSVWKGCSRDLSQRSLTNLDDTMTFEVERKYLLHRMPDLEHMAVTAVWEIEQGYIPGTSITERVRRAKRDGLVKCTRTVKLGKGVKRIELEDEIDETLFAQLWPSTESQRVTKRRYVVSQDGHEWELDEFVDRDLVLLEIELTHEDQIVSMPDAFRAVLSREVTDDKSFTNWALSRMNTER
ncbi:MAG: hypothetical protein ACPGQS_02870 [Bradymonadia bacterium]